MCGVKTERRRLKFKIKKSTFKKGDCFMKILGKIVLGIGGMSCLGYLLRKSEDKLMEEKRKKIKNIQML